jgi:hypothetical protein
LNEIIDAAKGYGGRGYGYSKMKAAWTEKVAWHVKAARIPHLGRVRLAFTWVETSRRRNPDNIAAAHKFLLDGFVVAGVLVNDGWKEIAGWTDAFAVGKPSRVEVVIEEVE